MMDIHNILSVPIFILLVFVCVFLFIIQILFLNHILYDTYTTFVVGVQFNRPEIKNFINVYTFPKRGTILIGDFYVQLHPYIFTWKRITKYTICVRYEISGTTFHISILPNKQYKKCITINDLNDLSITKDLLYLINEYNYYVISNRFCD